ncbi:MFS transporter, partial [Streptomyces anthocyanicus]|uniref:MFS transporter n=1 Tax=Streptomyces anthocyanicus TaxID=68174 RepID=UPI00365666DC
PGAALLGAALLLALCGTGFALHPTASAAAPPPDGTATRTGAAERTRLPGSAYALRVTMVLQGAMFGASQAGITALTAGLGAPAQAGLVYAAMGVMSAAVGLSLAALPAAIGLTLRWRAATAGLVLLSLPLLAVDSLTGLYVVVTVLGAAYAPHLITVFALTERSVPAGRLADRLGRRGPLLWGHGALFLAYGLLLVPLPDAVVLPGVLVLLGGFYAATDGVLMALTGPFLTEGRQASGLALVQTAQALARVGAAVAFGALWTASGPETALTCALAALAVAVCCCARLLPRDPAPEPRDRRERTD